MAPATQTVLTHKDGAHGRAGMADGAGGHGDRAAPVWAAAGAASAWAAAVHGRAALSAYGRAWKARADMYGEMMKVADAKGRAAEAGDPAVEDAMREMAGAMGRGAASMQTAGRAFEQAARRGRAAAGRYGRAADAYGRAGKDKRARAALRLKGEVRRMVREAARWKKTAGREEGMLARRAAKWVGNADAWATGEFELDGDRSTMLAEKAMLHKGADEERASSAGMAEAAAEDERAATAELERAAAATALALAKAARVRELEGAQEAAAALDDAMAAVRKATGGRGRTA